MCGIVGEYFFDKNYKINNFDLLLNEIKSRGPDYSGFFVKDNLALGHSRLSIIDLSSASNQPYQDNEAQLTLVYNGCIYNYKKLKKILEKNGHSFKTTGDTEVVLKSYKEWGYECLKKFEGDFAFAIWDNKKRKLFLARDRFGVKPLYYHYSKNFFRFGSNIQSLLAKEDINLELDYKSLHLHFSLHSAVTAPKTIFKNINKIKPGHYMVLGDNNNLVIKQYWKLNILKQDQYISDEIEAKNLIKDSLVEAIEKRIDASDIDVGVLLSGGLDSSLIVALAIKKFPKLKTYSIGFDDDEKEKGSEFFYSDQVANHFKTDHKKFIVNNRSVLSKLPETFKSMSEPMVAQDAVAFYMLSEIVSKEVKVVLSGQGADEGFGGYFWYQKIKTEQNNYANFLKHYVDRDHDEMTEFLNYKFTENYTSNMIKKIFDKNKSTSLISKVLNYDVTNLVVDDPVKRVDNMTMAWGLEARVPFLDHQLIEASTKIDPNIHLLRDGKNILKKISDNILPKDIISRKKGYFPMPALKFIRGEYYDLVYDILTSSECINRNIYNMDYIKKLLKKPNAYTTAIDGNKLWHAAATELWFQQNITKK